jgi:hypothetical protein
MKLNSLYESIILTSDDPGGSDGGVYNYNIIRNGNNIGYMLLSVMNNEDDLIGRVEWIETVEPLGISGVKEVFNILKVKFPRLKLIGGDRISGAREKSGTAKYTSRTIK